MDTTRIPSSFALHSEDCSKENYMSNGDVDRTPHNIKHDQSNCESNLCQPLATIPKRSACEATHSSLSTPKTSKRRLDFSNANSPDSRKSNAVIISNVDRESHRPHNAREQSLESHNFWLNHEAIEKRVKLLKNLTKNGELLMNQPPELYIEADCDGNERTILAVCSDDRKRWMKIKRNQHVSKLDETTIKPFGLTRRYRCIPDIRGQVMGGVGFIFRALDAHMKKMVAIKFFCKPSDKSMEWQCFNELQTALEYHYPLHCHQDSSIFEHPNKTAECSVETICKKKRNSCSEDANGSESMSKKNAANSIEDQICDARLDLEGLKHIVKLHEVLVSAQIFAGSEIGEPTRYRASALVMDWADSGDLHEFVSVGKAGTPEDAYSVLLQGGLAARSLHKRNLAHRDIKPENFVLSSTLKSSSPYTNATSIENKGVRGMLMRLSDFGFVKKIDAINPEDLDDDPTTCYQPPERWLASRHSCAQSFRERWGLCHVPEDQKLLPAGDVFSLGVSAFFTIAHRAIVQRSNEGCPRYASTSETEDDESNGDVPIMNLFQGTSNGAMFDLLDHGIKGCSQTRFWSYWENYGLFVPLPLRRILDGLLNPQASRRWTADELVRRLC